MHRDDIQRLGAHAAREGLTLWDCPYYRADVMPGHTGESIVEWREKVEAWEAGWMAEKKSWKPPGGTVRYVPRVAQRLRN
ncbi:CrpP-related protein [Achromobacter pestifer]|uniref:Uncharacterized protein n=1 Tax=Achromobacter pestifer TaxID=1353889 RepID=A0A6S6ZL30_9BURK|nr:hypothetical protein LMG3431_04527 [Achromobacter pestifer]